ncbi:hypothetical protein [Hyphomonas pacifica]|uniref:Uncharacterized protein n=1 Tax=Hyphomonas pacifica TaxID=1280941 RepID=A0A062U9N6_9PROT|nr:hypothetical protein [Hyphomonas pacifica]KCZ52855.1 hypothetical protein HY2_06920 [Hyphomonas pacifica]RAN35319.1 hypothetical protein HY3_08450 [Hyphomonas pacifica]RAN38289.1 hypothetical protein HY11_00320 [Hyphomonas pacifica]
MLDDETSVDNQQSTITAKPISPLRNGVYVAFRQVLALLGLIMIAVAIPIAFLTPVIPVGLPIAILGVVLLGRNAMWGRRWMESVLARHPRVERFAPNWLMRLVFGREKRDVHPDGR